MQQEQHRKLIISETRGETSDVKIIYFDESTFRDISYKAGQYLTFVFHTEAKEARRSYSIAASPVMNEPLSIGVKRIPNGTFFKKTV